MTWRGRCALMSVIVAAAIHGCVAPSVDFAYAMGAQLMAGDERWELGVYDDYDLDELRRSNQARDMWAAARVAHQACDDRREYTCARMEENTGATARSRPFAVASTG